MNKIVIEYIIRLFSIISSIYVSVPVANVKDFISSFLKKEFPSDIVKDFIKQFDENFKNYSKIKSESLNQEFLHDLLLDMTQEVNDKLSKRDRFEILIKLLLFNKFLLRYPFHQKGNTRLSDLLREIALELKIDEQEYLDCKSFIEEKLYNLKNKENLLLVCRKKIFNIDINVLEKENFNGQLFFIIIKSVNLILFYFRGNDNIMYQNHVIFPENVYVLPNGTSIKGDTIEPIYYNQILRHFLSDDLSHLHFEAKDLDFRFKKSNNGIHELNMTLVSGQMIGIIGRSGVGKSTLLSLLNGSLRPQKGTVQVNGFDIYQDHKQLEGLVGFIPQDDLLIEELTVFKNLYLNAKLCFGDLSNDQVHKKVDDLLKELDLYDVQNLKVGSSLNKFISGGQRKRLNIALELIREPYILFADEPTSGLSSSDSEEVLQLFTQQALKGRIVVMNIHQPSSDTFKSFDKILLLDKEGYPVYFGNPVESIPYFNDLSDSFVKTTDSCQTCGNVNPESVFKILEEKKVNLKGEFINERKINSAEWHKNYQKQIKEQKLDLQIDEKIPKFTFIRPNALKQFFIFSERNILSKLANKQYVLLAFIITPILSVILALLCKNSGNDYNGYVFYGNDNLPAYLFMSVIVALFVGLIISAEDIYRDRKILKREAFLKLNKISYLKSKITSLIVLSAIQSLLFVIPGNLILEIHGMNLYFWIILFSTYCFANMVGLVISTLFNSIVVIYILVPLFIVPQILLSGTIVQFDKLHQKVVNEEFVPIVGDIMASRWSYEALVVAQFEKNKFQKKYFKYDKTDSYARFNVLFLIPELKESLNVLYDGLKDNSIQQLEPEFDFIRNEIKKLNEHYIFDDFENLNFKSLSYENIDEINSYVTSLNSYLINEINSITYNKDSITHNIIDKLGDIEKYNDFKNKNSNKSISELVLKRQTFQPFEKKDNKILRKIEPIYQIADSKLGRAHFFASEKRIGPVFISTLVYNVIMLWLMTFIFSIILIILFYRKF